MIIGAASCGDRHKGCCSDLYAMFLCGVYASFHLSRTNLAASLQEDRFPERGCCK